MSTPTPGPWMLATSNSWRRIVSERDSTPVCEPIKQPDGHPDLHFPNGGVDGPDAHILAASRDMYEALRDMVSGCDALFHNEPCPFAETVNRARAALAKAEEKS